MLVTWMSSPSKACSVSAVEPTSTTESNEMSSGEA